MRKDDFVAYGYKVYEQQHAIRNNFEIGRYFIDAAKFEQMSVFSVVPGDLIVSCSGTMGRAAVVPNEAAPGIINQALLRLRPVRGTVDATYLLLYLGTEWIQATYFSSTIGSAIKNVASVSTIRGMQVALPPLSLQKRVVAALNEEMATAERARAGAEAQLAQINALPAALLRRAFNGEL
ncbi:MAG: EcoKI restriction-modification system protein HsdS [Chloroflexi bacterium ADurb.Bin222]|nr:MAG: EcoKI restriction-modification system protein HsdS [Chloroflexi bacterium ADurb.Bin222]